MKDLSRVRFVTQNYRALQGLKLLPYAIWLFSLAVVSGFWRNPPLVVVLAFCLLGYIIAGLLSRLIENYYEHHFGRVDPKSKRQQWGEQVVWTVSIVILWILTTMVQAKKTTSLTLILSTSATYFIMLCFRKDWRGWWPYVIIPVVTLVTGMSPLVVGFPVDNYLASPLAWAYFVISLGLALQSIFDHLHFVRTFQPMMEDENGETI